MSFAWPLIFLLLPVPFVIYRLPAITVNGMAVKVPFFQDWMRLSSDSNTHAPSRRKIYPLLWLSIVWALLILAAARPQTFGPPTKLDSSGRDLMMAVDLSGSMKERDLQLNGRKVNRLAVVKVLGSEFLEKRQGDRVGLIVFGTKAYVYTPISIDLKAVSKMLVESQINLAGQKTAIGDAIGLAVSKLQDQEIEQKVLIMLTDGQNTSGELEPIQAAKLAAKSDIKVYTIGIGSDEIIEKNLFFQQRRNPAADLDEATLTKIAELTGGQYFRAKATEDLKEIYDVIENLEPSLKEDQVLRQSIEWYFFPLAIALLLSIGFVTRYGRSI